MDNERIIELLEEAIKESSYTHMIDGVAELVINHDELIINFTELLEIES